MLINLGAKCIISVVLVTLGVAVSGLASASSIAGDWILAPVAGSIGVGPAKGDTSWWASGEATPTERACLFDDIYRFGADGSFANVMGDESWIEAWQGNDGESCGALVAPHDGSNAATYVYDEAGASITVNGLGAHIGLAKVYNGGELTSPADAQESITYTITAQTDTTMTLDIEIAGGGYWRFKLAKVVAPAIAGDWKLAPVAGSIGVGPAKGDTSWWASGEATPTERACLFDDIYRFGADGSFANVMGDESWIEAWQGNDGESCGALVAPHDGSNAATYVYDEAGASITVNGLGAHIGLAKVYNGGELTSPADAQESITYTITAQTDTTMTLDIEIAGGGYWRFKLAKVVAPAIAGDWKLAPVAGSIGVGPAKGDTSWWASGEATPTERACLFDDIYRFGADGSFANVMGEQSWIEAWQGNDGESCGALVAPHDGSNAATYVYDESAATITVNGLGAHIGLAKVYNGGELSSPADAVSSIIYEVSNVSCNNMTLYVDELSGGGYWQFLLIPSGDNDSDGDGVCDVLDPFPADSSESTDADLDGIGNNADTDDDGDGVPDITDVFPLDASESIDSDSDGIGNNSDNDDDNDGVADHADAFPLDHTETMDTDSDGIGNNTDNDDDGDGVADSADAFPLNANESVDTDLDGIGDNIDLDADNDGVENFVTSSVLNRGVVDHRWEAPISATELLIDGTYKSCLDSPMSGPSESFIASSCAYTSWDVILDTTGHKFLEILIQSETNESTTTAAELSFAEIWIQSSSTATRRGYDLSQFTQGFIQFDVKVIDDNVSSTVSFFDLDLFVGFKASYRFPSTVLSVTQANEWVTFTIPIKDFLDQGYPFNTSALSAVQSPFRIGVKKPTGRYLKIGIDKVNWISHFNSPESTGYSVDIFPLDSTEWLDTDADGVGNNADNDDDGDGVSDAQEAIDGSNPLVGDTDGDGYSDFDEISEETDPLEANSTPRRGLNVMLIKAALDKKKAKEEAEE